MAKDEAYRRAEQKIEEARSGATELDLSNKSITVLPGSLGELTQLQTLHLTQCQLDSVPDWVSKLTNLEETYLYQNRLSLLPNWIGKLTRLQKYARTKTTLPKFQHPSATSNGLRPWTSGETN